jgi:NAD(P)-dependent dehydrogenase (short-subunit alcohol dehydrogenase family)
MKLDNSIAAVVTGGASGLGCATAEALAAKGVRVAIFDLDEQNGGELAAALGGVDGVIIRSVDVSSYELGAGKAGLTAASYGNTPVVVVFDSVTISESLSP